MHEVWEALTAVGTIGAVIVALWVTIFGPRTRARPILSATITMAPPEPHRVVSTAIPPGRVSLLKAPDVLLPPKDRE